MVCLLTTLNGIPRAEALDGADGPRLEARAFADQGANAFARGDYERARDYFERAYRIVPAPTVALFEARALIRMRRLVEARAAYLRALSTRLTPDSPAPFAPAVAAAGAELAELMPRIPRLKVAIRGGVQNDPAIDVRIDQRRLARSELGTWLFVDPGAHAITATNGSDVAEPLRVVLAEGDARSVQVAAVERPSDPKRTWGFASLGVGGAGLVLGVSAGLVAMNAYDEVERRCDDGVCPAGSSGADALERFRDWRTVSAVGYTVAAIGAGTGLALLLTSNRGSSSGVGLTLRPAVDGVRMEGSW